MMSCCVLDLDNTLVFSQETDGDDYTIRFKDNERFLTVMRPHLDEFLEGMRKHFHYVGIWSAGSKDYVKKVVNLIDFDFDFVWSADQCEKVLRHGGDIKKPLIKILKESEDLDWNGIFIVDDRADIATDNKKNHFLVKAFEGEKNDKELQHLYQFINDHLQKVDDIRFLCTKWNSLK